MCVIFCWDIFPTWHVDNKRCNIYDGFLFICFDYCTINMSVSILVYGFIGRPTVLTDSRALSAILRSIWIWVFMEMTASGMELARNVELLRSKRRKADDASGALLMSPARESLSGWSPEALR